MAALFDRGSWASAHAAAELKTMETTATRSSAGRVRWAGMGDVLTNRRPGLARRSATLATGRRARKSRRRELLPRVLGARLLLRRQDDGDVLEVALRERR